MSIERINNSKGYTKSNTVLICIEFNTTDTTPYRSINTMSTGFAQWSKQKFNLLMESLSKK